MRNSSLPKKTSDSPTRSHIHWILSSTLLLLAGIGVFLAFTANTQTNTHASSKSRLLQATVPSSAKANQPIGMVPGTTPVGQPTGTPAPSNSTPVSATATPTLLPSTSQPTRSGVFSLAAGGPLPVPESVLHPTNIARLVLNTTLVSVYAGSMAQNPQLGILCVLRESLTSGQLTLQIYQAPHADGPLTILAIQNTKLKLTDTKSEGYFDLATNQFQW